MDPAIAIDGVSKKYCKSLRRSMIYGLSDLSRQLLRRRSPAALRPAEFWALRDISFEVRKGEWLGLIGRNGAGKSTLLKLLACTLPPNEGRIRVDGHLSALIELGAGFHPLLTGRENLYVQTALMGIPKRDVDRRFDAIVEFAGIGDFLDSPVKFYSSGMHARLGFAIATAFDPTILLVDEVLAVGDLAFQDKCMRRMDAMRADSLAVVMVQQHTYWIEALCDRAVWLDAGRIVMVGDARDVVRAYLDQQDMHIGESLRAAVEAPSPAATTPVVIERIELIGRSGESQTVFDHGEPMLVRIHFAASRRIDKPLFNIRVFARQQEIFEASMLIDGPATDAIEGRGVVECRLDALPLTPRVYEVVVFARGADGITDILPMRTYAVFSIAERSSAWELRGPMAQNHLRNGSPVFISRSWRFLPPEPSRSSAGAAAISTADH